jgi:DNA-binding SARP family transcriptional activator
MAWLGTPDVRHADSTVAFATRKTLALLVYLAVEREPHTREHVAAMFWPDSDSQHARTALRFTLAALRRSLGGAEHLLLSRERVGFDHHSTFDLDLLRVEAADAADLARLSTAADCWRGEFLEGFSLPDAPAFDTWASMQREQWHRRAERVFEHLAVARAATGSGGRGRGALGRHEPAQRGCPSAADAVAPRGW